MWIPTGVNFFYDWDVNAATGSRINFYGVPVLTTGTAHSKKFYGVPAPRRCWRMVHT